MGRFRNEIEQALAAHARGMADDGKLDLFETMRVVQESIDIPVALREVLATPEGTVELLEDFRGIYRDYLADRINLPMLPDGILDRYVLKRWLPDFVSELSEEFGK